MASCSSHYNNPNTQAIATDPTATDRTHHLYLTPSHKAVQSMIQSIGLHPNLDGLKGFDTVWDLRDHIASLSQYTLLVVDKFVVDSKLTGRNDDKIARDLFSLEAHLPWYADVFDTVRWRYGLAKYSTSAVRPTAVSATVRPAPAQAQEEQRTASQSRRVRFTGQPVTLPEVTRPVPVEPASTPSRAPVPPASTYYGQMRVGSGPPTSTPPRAERGTTPNAPPPARPFAVRNVSPTPRTTPAASSTVQSRTYQAGPAQARSLRPATSTHTPPPPYSDFR